MSYSYVVTNTGNVTLTGIVLVDDNDNNDVSCPATSLPPNGTMTCTATHTFTQAELDANGSPAADSGKVTNTVTASSDEAPSATDDLAIPIVQSPALSVVKSAVPLSYDHVGQVIAYSYKVTNTGNVTLQGPFTVNDNKVTVTCPATASLAPGAFITCTAFHTVTQADLDAGRILNVASATNGVVTSPPDTALVVAVAAPELSVVKSSPTASLSAPQTVNYSYVVTNTGNVTLTGIALSDDNDNNNLSCPLTTLAPTASMTCTATHTFTQAELDAKGSPAAGSGQLKNTVTATSNEASPATDSLSIPIVQTPALKLEKSAFPTTYDHVGELITYTYTVTNIGNVTVVGQISITDDKLTVTCPPTASLAPGASLTCTATHVVTQADLDAGQIANVASASNGVVTSPPDTVTVGADQRPSLTVAKSSPTTSLAAPQTVSYSYVVTNTGNVTLTGISLADDNVSGTVTCPGTTLAPGASMTCTATHAFTQAELDADGSPVAESGELTNNVTVSSDQVPDVSDSLSIPIEQSPALTLVKSATPMSYDQVGDVISYSYLVTNTGNVTLLGPFTVNDSKVAVTCPATASLAPGASITCTASHTVTQADLDAGKIVNVASATNGVVTSPEDTVTVGAVASPLLEVVKSSLTTDLTAPQTVQYSYLVTNAGNVTLTGIALTDDNDANNLACPKTSLVPDESMTCTATHVFTQAELDANGSPVAGSGLLENTVTATSTQAPPATDNLEIPIVLRPELKLVKSASPLSYNQVGQVITYSYVVTNTGNVTVLGQITVTDDKVTVTCPPTASLAPGASITCTASHTVTQADLDAGQIVNTASASNGVVTSPPDTATVDAIAAPRLLVVKSSVTKSLSAPQTVTYTYLVRNVGNVTVTGISLSDDNDNNDLSCPQTTLAPAAFMTCTATHTFTQAELDANGSPVADSDKLANTVTVTSDQAPTATDDHVIPIVQSPALTLVKSASPQSYDQVGDVISYSYKVTNTGNVTLPGPFTVADNKVTVTCPATLSLAPGAFITCTASHTVTQADLDAGQILNVRRRRTAP